MKWIKVAEQLPPDDTEVLACEEFYTNGEIAGIEITTIASYGHNYGRSKEWYVKTNCGGWEYEANDCNPVYWMSLPEPPK